MSENFKDPLDELINKHKAAMGELPETVIEKKDGTVDYVKNNPAVSTVEDEIINTPEPSVTEFDESSEDIDYGDNDMAMEMAREDAAEAEARQKLIDEKRAAAEALEASKTTLPPRSLDKEFQAEAIGFQADKLAIVTTMVNKVVAKYHITTGGIPENIRRMVMGDLIDVYHRDGEVITPEFEDIILQNWIDDDGQPIINKIGSNGVVESDVDESSQETDDDTDTEPEEEKPENPTINITVEKNTPVSINVDKSIIAETEKTREVNVYVKEVSNKELLKSTVIENSQIDGIITEYDSGINDVPITLPLSGYRCVMKAINWFDFIRLTAPTSKNSSDNELKKWSVIYKHMKNVSIGDFKDFDDFLHKTKFQDKELLMWAILVATGDEEETLSITCANKKCKNLIELKYHPRNIVHLDEELIPSHYQKTHDVAIGPDAIKHFDEVNGRLTRYVLPDTKIIVEVNEPSAHEFITVKLPLMQSLYERYKPGQDMSAANFEDPEMVEFDYLSANALFISAMVIVKDGKEYRYTNWDDIEKIITTSLSADDSGVLLKIIEKVRSNVSPVSFYIEDVTCPVCKNHVDKIPVTDIGNTLLFQVSRRLANTPLNLIETPQN